MNGRTDVVLKTWEGQFLGSTGATNAFIPFQYQNREAVLRDSDRCRQTIWSGADHDRIIFVSGAHHSAINSSSFPSTLTAYSCGSIFEPSPLVDLFGS